MNEDKNKTHFTFKTKVASEALSEENTPSELARECQIHLGQIRNWKNIVIRYGGTKCQSR